MISTTGIDQIINYASIPNGVFYTATQNCIVYIHSNTTTPLSSQIRVGSGSYTRNLIASSGLQTGAKLNVGDTLIATGMNYPFKIIIIKYD